MQWALAYVTILRWVHYASMWVSLWTAVQAKTLAVLSLALGRLFSARAHARGRAILSAGARTAHVA